MKKTLVILVAFILGGVAMAQTKTVVVYFSASGTTKGIAEKIAQIESSDLIEIVPKQPYSSADLNWHDSKSRTSQEKDNRDGIRPEIAHKIDVSAYDIIYLGFPIWWYEAPNIIYTFVENADLSGKTIYTFFTSGGSGIGRTMQILERKAPKAVWKSAKRFSGQVVERDIKNWK